MSLSKRSKTKTEHAGAKNGGGFWGYREDAKHISKKHRRANDKDLTRHELKEVLKNKASKK